MDFMLSEPFSFYILSVMHTDTTGRRNLPEMCAQNCVIHSKRSLDISQKNTTTSSLHWNRDWRVLWSRNKMQKSGQHPTSLPKIWNLWLFVKFWIWGKIQPPFPQSPNLLLDNLLRRLLSFSGRSMFTCFKYENFPTHRLQYIQL